MGFYSELSLLDQTPKTKQASRLDYYFDVFLQDIKNVNISEYIKELADDVIKRKETIYAELYEPLVSLIQKKQDENNNNNSNGNPFT